MNLTHSAADIAILGPKRGYGRERGRLRRRPVAVLGKAMINPPTGWAGTDSRSSYRIAETNSPDIPDWEAQAVMHPGSRLETPGT